MLNVPRCANAAAVEKASRDLLLHVHPDRNRDNPDATAASQKIIEAKATLLDERKRDGYEKEHPPVLTFLDLKVGRCKKREAVLRVSKERHAIQLRLDSLDTSGSIFDPSPLKKKRDQDFVRGLDVTSVQSVNIEHTLTNLVQNPLGSQKDPLDDTKPTQSTIEFTVKVGNLAVDKLHAPFALATAKVNRELICPSLVDEMQKVWNVDHWLDRVENEGTESTKIVADAERDLTRKETRKDIVVHSLPDDLQSIARR